MATFEWIIPLLLGAALLATLTRRVGAPYPTFLATGSVGLAFVPASPNWTLDPQLALTLFVAPVLLDAAYDTSLRDLRRNWVLLCAFTVVLGTLVIQGLKLKPLISRVGLTEDDTVKDEVRLGRTQVFGALLDAIEDDDTMAGKLLRKEYGAVVELNGSPGQDVPIDEVPGGPLRRRAIAVARDRALRLRSDEVIGDDAYRVPVQELDWAELSAGGGRTD